MKAAQINEYGGIEVLTITNDTPKPLVKNRQVLIEVYAAGINVFDWKLREGYVRKMAPIPFPATLGGDFAGKIIESGDTNFTNGDDVYGSAMILSGGSGSFAQYATAKNTTIARKPSSINFIDAASLPLVGVSAIQALEDAMKLQKGQKILIHGGAGGIGSVAIQLAKSLGAFVTTTVSTNDSDFVKSLDADAIIDYKQEKFEELLKEYDCVFDTVGGDTTDKSFLVLKKGGILVSMLGLPNQELAKKYDVRTIGQSTKIDTNHLTRLAELVDTGKIKAEVDRIFPLEKVKEAFTYQETVHPRGKVVLQIKD